MPSLAYGAMSEGMCLQLQVLALLLCWHCSLLPVSDSLDKSIERVGGK